MMPFGSRKKKKVATMEAQIEVDTKEVQEEDMDEEDDEYMVEVEEDHPLVLIVDKWVMFHDFVPNH
jgi:hypothetical protein